MVRWQEKKDTLNICRILPKASPATSFKHVLALCSNYFIKQWEGRNLTRKTAEVVKGFTEPPEADPLSAELVLFLDVLSPCNTFLKFLKVRAVSI